MSRVIEAIISAEFLIIYRFDSPYVVVQDDEGKEVNTTRRC
jgi:hypothetical protein